MRDWMRNARKQANLTMSEIAQRCGISESYYSMIESGERQKKLDITLAVKLAEAFDVSLETIVLEEAKKPRH